MKNTSMYIPASEGALLQPNAAGMLESQAREATPHWAEATTKLPTPTEGGVVIQEQDPHQPRVWDCHAGKEYPRDAVYVGCRTIHPFKGNVIREGTIFGNGTNPLVSHDGSLPSEREFRAYAVEKLKDQAFHAEAEKLRGKDLLCWCVQEGKRRAEFCHARVWLELINNPQDESPTAELSAEQRQDFDWGYYEQNFLTKAEADALFEMAKAQPRLRPIIKRSGYALRRCASTCWSVRDRNDDSVAMVPLLDAPPEILSLQRKLNALAENQVNYFSLQAYENERDHIGWHQHREDKCRDARVFIMSLGERRSFGVDKLCPECLLCDACNQRRCHPDSPPCFNSLTCRAAKKHRATCPVRRSTKTILLPTHGSLIALTSAANDWYEHAVLDDKEPKGLRISIDTKCIPPEDAAAGYVPRELRHAGGFSHEEPR
jgi:alkylated DNA repair dioxygenase AlkB